MKKFVTLLLFLISFTAFSQILNPVKWEYGSEKISETEYNLIFVAKIDYHWALYSQFVEEGGPLPTVFSFTPTPDFERIETVNELDANKVTQFDSVFEMVVSKYYDKAIFKQRIRVKSPDFSLSGNIDFMTCDDTKCTYLPDNPFTFNYNEESGFIIVGGTPVSNLEVSENADEILYGMPANSLSKALLKCSTQGNSLSQDIKASNNSMWKIFGLGFLGGLLALLTPCVFPMIPLTVSFFTKKGGDGTEKGGVSKAILYGFFIVIVYLALSIPFHLLDSVNPDILNEISTNVWLNVMFFIIFIFFAFSFFGYYELTLPSTWTNSTSKGEGIGGILGVFFMALTLSIVSFSCTGPILGSLLAGSLSVDGGVRTKSIDAQKCVVVVKHRWINQNPFKSMFWAVQGMAAELSTGALIMMKIQAAQKNISMLVIKNNASFSKKAKGVVTFSCTQGNLVDQALQNAIATGEGQTLILTANGIDSSGDEVSSFDFEWSLKLKQKKIKR